MAAYVAYRTLQLQLPAKSRVWPHFHVSRLKSYKPPLDELGQPTIIEFQDLSEGAIAKLRGVAGYNYRPDRAIGGVRHAAAWRNRRWLPYGVGRGGLP